MLRIRSAQLAGIALALFLATPAVGQQLETLLLEGDPIPGSDEKFVAIEFAQGAEDGVAISAGIDLVPRLASGGFAGPQPTLQDGIWLINRDRRIQQVVPFLEEPLLGLYYGAGRTPTYFDSEGRVAVFAGFGDWLWRVKPGHRPAVDLEISRGDTVDAGTRVMRNVSTSGRLGGELIVTANFGGGQLEHFLGDPRGAGRNFLDRFSPLAPGTDVLAVPGGGVNGFVQKYDEDLVFVAREGRTLPDGTSQALSAVAHFDVDLRPRLLVQTGDPVPGAAHLYPSGFGSRMQAIIGRRDEVVLSWSGLWRSDFEGNLENIVQLGDPAPGTTRSFTLLPGWRIDANSRGQVAFGGILEGDFNASGFWVAEPDGTIRLRAQAGQVQDDIELSIFSFISTPMLTNDGGLFFRNRPAAGQGGANDGILMADAEGGLHKIAVVGQTLEVRDGDQRVIETVFERGEFDGGLALEIAFTDGSKGVFRAFVPKPKRFCGWRWSKRGGDGWKRVRRDCRRGKAKRRGRR